jgi:glycosyltransferase involved in cell wall biosynthesis
VFGHFGSLSPTRSLAPALQAIAALLKREPALRELLRLEVYGSALDPQAAQLVESLKLAGVVLPIGRLEFDPATGLSGRARVMQRMQQCDVLLMMHGDMAEAGEYIPSKLYEYFWARRPVLALTCENAQLDTLVVEHGGWVAPTRDIPAVVEAFAAAVGRWRDSGLPDVSLPPVTVADAVARILRAVDEVGRG